MVGSHSGTHTMLYITCMWLISLSVQSDGLMEWSKWSQWSECTKTCNRGVSQRRRQCNENPNAVRSTSHLERCPGHYRQYIVCNTEKCPTPEPDYRKEQCVKFNTRRFAGKSYIWKSFIDPRDRCTISCRPVGFSFYARIVSGVPDGSICFPTSDHICVNGLCKFPYDTHEYSVLCVKTSIPMWTSRLHMFTILPFTFDGTQETKIVCVKTNSKTIVTDANCNPFTKLPTQTTVCNTAPCPARWTPGEWSKCSLTCGEGQMTRQVECKQKYSKTFFKRVSASACLNQTRLITVKKCQNKPCSQWEIKEWSKCSVECGLGQRSRKVTCVSADGRVIPDYECRKTKPSTSEVCNMGSCAKTWFFTEWSKECSSSCGHGVLRRKVHCSADDGSSLEDIKCKLNEKPKSEKSCKNDQPCGGLWFTGPWSECSATCGQAFKIRSAACVKKLHSTSFVVVSPKNCVKKDKPATKEPCLTMPACPAQWHMTEWTQCSASCGTGSKTREVKCMDSHLRHSTLCNPDRRPITRQSCNSHSCNQKPLNTDPSCQDQIKLCHLVVQARLCSYKYYQRKCCETCYKHRVHHKHHHSS
ncbi:4 isoform X1 [Octopus vulgaris]|uniref:4 isoform X1 n=1 Tax=Octopus vulgaris TaxID=6645 RepID=A0AA36BB13_OCTVU|nr:4 isoform X1 [Octopus vulgaris]